MSEKLVQLICRPGVKRDGTRFEGNYYIDALWCRWQRGRPRKMGGYKMISGLYEYPSRGVIGYSREGLYYVHSGSSSNLEVQNFDSDGIGGGLSVRTPSGFVTDPNNLWQFSIMYDGGSNFSRIIAHAAPNLTDIDSDANRDIYSGDAYGTGALTAITSSAVSGGICVLYPYLFGFGSDGEVIWSVPNQPTDFTGSGSGSARITGSKIVVGLPTRGGSGNNPSGLFFALDSLVRCTFTGGAAIFNFDQITSGYSIMSSQGVVEYDGVYYWPGIDRFLTYSGVITELPNDMNVNYFFDNINVNNYNKVVAVKNQRWGEIWWLYPEGNSTECNRAVIFNVRERTWYDTPISRISGYYSGVFKYPVMFDNSASATGKTRLWMREFGVDEFDGTRFNAIKSYFQTANFSLTSTGFSGEERVGEDINIVVKRLEPDFVQSGNLTVTFQGRKYPQSDVENNEVYTLVPGQEKQDVRFRARSFDVTVESNVINGDYQMGETLLVVQQGDSRP